MEISKLNTLSSILKRYKLAHRILNDNDIEIGGGHNIKYLKRYYFYIPLIIGSIIVISGFLIDLILIKFCGVPFLLYAVYGIGQIYIALKENRNTTVICNGEIRISKNDRLILFNTLNIKNFEVKIEPIEDEMYLSELLIIDKENNEQMLLTLIDDELAILENNMKYIKEFIQKKINATKTTLG